MIIDCSLDWQKISLPGECLRPGGSALTARAMTLSRLSSRSQVIDVGCGPGGTLDYLIGQGITRVTGLDLSGKLLLEARQSRESAHLVQGDCQRLPFQTQTFDALFCECVLSLLTDRIAALTEFARVLREGGFLIMSDVFEPETAGEGQRNLPIRTPLVKGPLTRQSLLSLLQGLNFSSLLWEEHREVLKEFVAQMILAGHCLPSCWTSGLTRSGRSGGNRRVSYFLSVSQKNANPWISP